MLDASSSQLKTRSACFMLGLDRADATGRATRSDGIAWKSGVRKCSTTSVMHSIAASVTSSLYTEVLVAPFRSSNVRQAHTAPASSSSAACNAVRSDEHTYELQSLLR